MEAGQIVLAFLLCQSIELFGELDDLAAKACIFLNQVLLRRLILDLKISSQPAQAREVEGLRLFTIALLVLKNRPLEFDKCFESDGRERSTGRLQKYSESKVNCKKVSQIKVIQIKAESQRGSKTIHK